MSDTTKSKNIPIAKIIPDIDNPNLMSPAQMDALEKSITTHGFAKDVWVNEEKDGMYRMIDGHHRLQIMKKLGKTSLPCRVFNVSDAQVRILRQVGNILAGKNIKEKEAAEVQKIIDAGMIQELEDFTGQTTAYYQKLAESINDDSSALSDDIADNISDNDKIKHFCVVPGCDHSDETEN